MACRLEVVDTHPNCAWLQNHLNDFLLAVVIFYQAQILTATILDLASWSLLADDKNEKQSVGVKMSLK